MHLGPGRSIVAIPKFHVAASCAPLKNTPELDCFDGDFGVPPCVDGRAHGPSDETLVDSVVRFAERVRALDREARPVECLQKMQKKWSEKNR